MKSKLLIKKEIWKVGNKQVKNGKQFIRQPRILTVLVRTDKRITYIFEDQMLRRQVFCNQSFEKITE